MAKQAIRHDIRFLDRDDYEPLLEFLTQIFQSPIGFQELLPAIYSEPEVATQHVGIKADGRIIAAAGLFPIEWHIGDRILRIAGIGSVAVDPKHRGNGLMSAMMNYLISEIVKQGYELSYLGGQRQRYQYFGWEKAGCRIEADVSRSNFKQMHSDQSGRTIQLKEPADSIQVSRTVLELHQNQITWCSRSDANFINYLRNWQGRPLIIHDQANSEIGYAAVKINEKLVFDLQINDVEQLESAVQAILEHLNLPKVKILMNPVSYELVQAVGRFAESVKVADCGNWRVFNMPAVLSALITAWNRTVTLPNGQVHIGNIDTSETIKVTVEDGCPDISISNQKADVATDTITLTRLLFGPLKPSHVITLPPSAAILDAWCPLPLSINPPDCV